MALVMRSASAVVLAGAVVVLAFGCNSAEKPVEVTGKVTFKGEPVAEGDIQFVEDRTGRGAEVKLESDGAYKASLFAGEYKVVVTPPYIVDNSSGMPNPYYKKVKNVPKKYHSTATSGLSVKVSRESTKHDFDLKP